MVTIRAMLFIFQGKYKQAKEAYEQFVQSEGIEDIHKATAHKQLGRSFWTSLYMYRIPYLAVRQSFFLPKQSQKS